MSYTDVPHRQRKVSRVREPASGHAIFDLCRWLIAVLKVAYAPLSVEDTLLARRGGRYLLASTFTRLNREGWSCSGAISRTTGWLFASCHCSLSFPFGHRVWAASCWLLPERLLTGRTGAQALAGAGLAGGRAWLASMRIFGLNLVFTMLILVPANLVITKRGYPFGSFGVYEIMSYVLVGAATTSIGRWRIKRWRALRGTTERVRILKERLPLNQRRNPAVALAFALLAVAWAWEAIKIAAAIVS